MLTVGLIHYKFLLGFDLDAVLGEGKSSIVPVTNKQDILSVIPLELESPSLNPET